MNVFAKFDKIPSMILQDIKETKRYGHTHGRTDNVKTVYPPTNTVCGGYNNKFLASGRNMLTVNCLFHSETARKGGNFLHCRVSQRN